MSFSKLYFQFLFLQKAGCDGVVGSEMKPDICGVCGGDGKSCNFIDGKENCCYTNVYCIEQSDLFLKELEVMNKEIKSNIRI